MNRIALVFLLIILILILLLTGVLVGTSWQKYICLKQEAVKGFLVAKNLSSKSINLISAHGKVVKVEGENITISSEGEELILIVKENTPIQRIFDSGGIGKSRIIKLEDIKPGDELNLILSLLTDGSLKANLIIVLQK
jgi:hypothetical protein